MSPDFTAISRWRRHIPLTIRIVVEVVVLSLVVLALAELWQVDQRQSFRQARVRETVAESAQGNQQLFIQFLEGRRQALRLVVTQKSLADYLTAHPWSEEAPEILSHRQSPPWLASSPVRRTFSPIGTLLLLDRRDRVREVVVNGEEDFLRELLPLSPLPQSANLNQTFITTASGRSFLLSWEEINDPQGERSATLMEAIPIQDDFFSDSSHGVLRYRGTVALLMGSPPRTIAASHPLPIFLPAVAPGLSGIDQDHFVLSSSFGGVQLLTMISAEQFIAINRSLPEREWRWPLLLALTAGALLLFVLLRWTRNLHRITAGIIRFSWESLGVQPLLEGKRDAWDNLREQCNHLIQEMAQRQEALRLTLAEQEQKVHLLRPLAQAMVQSPVAMMITDKKGQIIHVNAEVSRLTGYSAEEMVGKNPRLFASGQTPPETYPHLWSTLTAGESWQGMFHNRRRNGETYWEMDTITRVRDEGDLLYYVAVKEDATQRVRMEQALQQAKQAAEAASQMKNDFLANITHELRTPLNSIVGISRLMADGEFGEINKNQRKNLRTVLESAVQLSMLIDDLLALSQVDSGPLTLEMSRFDLHELTRQTYATLLEAARLKGLSLNYRLGPDTMREVMGDPIRVRQVLWYILHNAVKFTQQGMVTLAVENDALPNARPGHVRFTITDTGIGIAEEKQKVIFEPFTQGDNGSTREFGGSGLGLTIAKRLVDRMGGSIGLESRINEGSTFSIVLPFVSHGEEERIEPVREPLPSGVRALVAGRNPMDRLILKKLLDGLEMEVKEVSECTQTYEVLAATAESPYRLLFLDCCRSFPGGIEEVQRIRSLPSYHHLPILVFSAESLQSPQAVMAQRQGIYFLNKPLQRPQVYAAIQQAMLGRWEGNSPLQEGAQMETLHCLSV